MRFDLGSDFPLKLRRNCFESPITLHSNFIGFWHQFGPFRNRQVSSKKN